MTIREYISENKKSFDHYRSRGTWNGYKVYMVWSKKNEGKCVGMPTFALEKEGVFILANLDEVNSIMGI